MAPTLQKRILAAKPTLPADPLDLHYHHRCLQNEAHAKIDRVAEARLNFARLGSQALIDILEISDSESESPHW